MCFPLEVGGHRDCCAVVGPWRFIQPQPEAARKPSSSMSRSFLKALF